MIINLTRMLGKNLHMPLPDDKTEEHLEKFVRLFVFFFLRVFTDLSPKLYR